MHQERIRVFSRAASWPILDYGDAFFSMTPAIVRELRELSYMEQWKKSIAERWYHVQLEDHSIITFSETDESASFSYIQCPLIVPTFREFLQDRGIAYTQENRRNFQDEYDLAILTASAHEHPTPLRYDLDKTGYRKGVHPLAHIHIGLNNQIRIATKVKLNPVSFALFIMRHYYPAAWEKLLSHQESFNVSKSIRPKDSGIPREYWCELDQIELHLG